MLRRNIQEGTVHSWLITPCTLSSVAPVNPEKIASAPELLIVRA